MKITYNLETTPPGVAGSIKQFEPHINDEFFVIYGDMLSFVDYSKMQEAWRAKPSSALGIQRMQKLDDYKDADVAELDADGKFIAIHPKPHTATYPNAYRMRGTFIMRKKILSYIPTDRYYEIGRDLLPDIIKRGESFYSYESNDYSKGIDTEEKWHEVEGYLNKNNITFDKFATGI